MSKIFVFTLFFVLNLSLQAHDLWVIGKNKDVFEADIVYGHDFPYPEQIKKERLNLFEPIKVMSENFTQTLTQSGENYHYKGKNLLQSGNYIITAKYKPTAWVELEDGKWEMGKTRKDIKTQNVKYCGISTMSSKQILNIDKNTSIFATKPLNDGLEFTPLSDEIKENVAVKFRLTKNGEAIKKAKIYALYAGDLKGEKSTFQIISDENGEVEFKATKAGIWSLQTTVNSDSGDKDCEIFNDKASIVFEVK